MRNELRSPQPQQQGNTHYLYTLWRRHRVNKFASMSAVSEKRGRRIHNLYATIRLAIEMRALKAASAAQFHTKAFEIWNVFGWG